VLSHGSEVRYGFWLAEQAAGFAMVLWPVSLVVCALVWASTRQVPAEMRKRFRCAARTCLGLYAFPLVVLALGVVLEAPERFKPAPRSIGFLILGTVVLELTAAAIFVLWVGVGLRLRAIGLAALPSWLTLCAYLPATMSVTGDWI
jgi:hypothetical protein